MDPVCSDLGPIDSFGPPLSPVSRLFSHNVQKEIRNTLKE